MMNTKSAKSLNRNYNIDGLLISLVLFDGSPKNLQTG